MQGGCSEQRIKVSNQLALPTKQGADFRKALHDRVIETKKGKLSKELSKSTQVCLGIGIGKSPFMAFRHLKCSMCLLDFLCIL